MTHLTKQLYSRCPLRAIAFAMLVCLSVSFGFAQATNTGTVVGTVTDQSGAVVPDATVTLTDLSTNDTRTTVTGHTGQYAFVNVSPGSYIITASKAGFELNKIANQTVAGWHANHGKLQIACRQRSSRPLRCRPPEPICKP